ncbi:hypothetical protein A3Q56_07403, partial [Intoshia linei]
MTAEVVARKIYEELIPRYSVPKRIHTDMGTQFESELIRKLCEMNGSVKTETRPYHHEDVGGVERLNRTLKNMLKIKTVGRFDKNWENFIPEILVAIRNRQSLLQYINQIGENSKKYRKMMEKNHNSKVTRSDTKWQRDYISNNPVVEKLDKRFKRCVKFKKTYCYCKRGEVENDFMVECDSCKDWFHGECVKLSKTLADKMKNFRCKNCEKDISRVKRQVKVPQKFDNYEMKNIKNKGNFRGIRGRKVVVKNNLLDIDDLRKIFKVLEPQYACNTDGKITLIEFDKLNSSEQYSRIPRMLLTLYFKKYDDALFETKRLLWRYGEVSSR